MSPNRWLHLRHPVGFNSDQFARFEAHCRLFVAYAEAMIANWAALIGGVPPRYEYFPAELSADRRVATFPLGGSQTLGSRAWLENGSSVLLWKHFPVGFIVQLEEGITERIGPNDPLATNWRPAGGRRSIAVKAK